MDLLSQHEAFLRAIFDAPDDDLPRLVYADFLEENDDPDRAAFIRVQIERRRLLNLTPGDPALVGLKGLLPRELELSKRMAAVGRGTVESWAGHDRGFPRVGEIAWVFRPSLADAEALRTQAVFEHPDWFG